MDAKNLNQILVSLLPSLLTEWLPGGKLNGGEFKCGSVRGEAGNSLSVNIRTGVWKDFADSSLPGGDLISLYACINGVSNGEAIKFLQERYGDVRPTTRSATVVKKEKPKQIPAEINSPYPTMVAEYKDHNWKGVPSKSWVYRNSKGQPVGIIARYQPTSKKEILPWVHTDIGWIKGAMDKPRPLYNLPEILASKNPILIVEGEKAAEAAQELFKNSYTVTTWAGGAEAIKHTDFAPIFGKAVVIWPDADVPGIKCAEYICNLLTPHTNDLKLVTPKGKPEGWDVADAQETMKYEDIVDFLRSNHQVIRPARLPELIPADTEVTLTKSSDPVPIHNALAIAAELGLQVDGKMMPVPNSSNVYAILSKVPEFKDICYYDEFKNSYMTSWKTGKLRQWTEVEDRQLTTYLQSNYGLPKLPKHLVVDALLQCADANKKNPARDWLESLVWDGTHRLPQLFTTYCGSQDNDYTQAVSKNFMISIVARVFQPGCKVDNMVILEGEQGSNKSTFFKCLASQEYFAESSGDLNSKDFILNCQGKMVIEMAELTSLNKKDANEIKKMLSTATDNFRPPYGKSAQAFPRQFVFVGSTNDDSYLNDSTGARRFWPIRCSNIDIKKTLQDRDQLFAEAVSCFRDGASWWEVPESAKEEQESRRVSDVWEEVVSDYIRNNKFAVAFKRDDIFKNCLFIDIGKITRADQMRLSATMSALGYIKDKCQINGQRSYVYKVSNLGQAEQERIKDHLEQKSEKRVVKNYATNQLVEID